MNPSPSPEDNMYEQTESAALSATTSRNIDSILIAVEEAALAMRRGDTQQYRSHYSDLKHTLLPALAESHPPAPEGQALAVLMELVRLCDGHYFTLPGYNPKHAAAWDRARAALKLGDAVQAAPKLMESGQTGTDGSQKPNDADAIRSAKAGSNSAVQGAEGGITTPREPMTHVLKTDHWAFQEVALGRKTFEIRKADRDYRVGDSLRLLETVHTGAEMGAGAPLEYTGGENIVKVLGIMHGPVYGLAAGWCVMSIEEQFSSMDYGNAMHLEPEDVAPQPQERNHD